jgi:hypothetical protein
MKDEEINLFTFHMMDTVKKDGEINEILKKFWELEEIEGKQGTSLSVSDEKIMKMMKSEIVYDEESNRYQVPVPWKENQSELKNNYEMAFERLKSTERKLNANADLKACYGDIINNYEKKGYISKLTESDLKNTQWTLPHFPVIRLDKETTKVRIVFDASAKHNSLSLNDVIHQGPKLQNDLFEVLLRFRRNAIAIICDIQEMYLQVELSPPDRLYHRFLWRESPKHPVETYEFNRLVFGVNASPFLAQYVTQLNANKFEEKYPLAAETVINCTYMDDSMNSVENEVKGIDLYNELTELWGKAGMCARKWLSNSTEVLNKIPVELRASQVNLSESELPTVKTLGLIWKSDSDEFTYSYTESRSDMKITKRSVLRRIAALYDPLGFLVPFTVRAKMIMQKIWLTGLDWDIELPEMLACDIKQWYSELKDLSNIKVERCIHASEDTELHIFVDASSEAFGSVVYNKNSSLQKPKIVAAKGRVAPLKSLSIPRMELLAAVLGLTLTLAICSSLKMNIHQCTFWSDSMNVLYWIHSQSRKYKTFVANRVGFIHSHTSPSQWRYVPTKENPADLASRGTSITELAGNPQWWHGPDFLENTPELWPENKMEIHDVAKVEIKRKSAYNSYVTLSENNDFRLEPTRYSDWNRLVRISAWAHRFIDNCQVAKKERRLSLELSVQEIEQAEYKIIQTAQAECFSVEYQCLKKGKNVSSSSKLAPLNPKLDSEGVMRSDTRLKFVDFISYDARFPIILPRKHWVTKLIVKNCHEKTCHGGTNLTLAKLSGRYWVISAREEIRNWENQCAKCKRSKAQGSNQIMGALPVERFGQSMRAFTNTAVDYAGPFITKQGRGKTRLKRYLCVFTCLTVRAVHLEIAYSLDTNSFLNALNRFISRRGVPSVIISDNGTNFVGCVNELKDLYKKLDQSAIMKSAVNRKIEWKFIPPNAPHFGGCHEAMVKSAKKAVYAILGNADITDEELVTAVVGAENLINSRPLTYQTSNPNDDTALTPNHFLTGQLGGQFAPDIIDNDRYDVKKRWRYVQELLRHFWKRWLREYLPTLGSRSKWFQTSRDFKADDIVLIVDPNTPRGHWPLGRVTKVFHGPDGHVRVVDVQVGRNVFRRPISRLSLVAESSKSC